MWSFFQNVGKAINNAVVQATVDVGNSVGQFVPWGCSKCGKICPVSEFEGNVIQGAYCSSCRNQVNVGQQIKEAAQSAAIEIGNTVGKVIPWPCLHCGKFSMVSQFEGNVVTGAYCSSCHQKVDIAQQLAANIGNTYGQLLPWKCVRCGEWERISNFQGNIISGAYCPKCHKEIPIEFDIGDILFEVTMKKDKLIEICNQFNELLQANQFLHSKFMKEAQLQLPSDKTKLDYTFYAVRVGGGTLGFFGGEAFAASRLTSLAQSPGRLAKIARLFCSGVLKSCATFAGGLVVCLIAQAVIGAIFSYFQGEELKKKIQEMNEMFDEQLKFLTDISQQSAGRKNWRKVYEQLRQAKCKVTVRVQIIEHQNLGQFLQ